jgi:hypothetical protein
MGASVSAPARSPTTGRTAKRQRVPVRTRRGVEPALTVEAEPRTGQSDPGLVFWTCIRNSALLLLFFTRSSKSSIAC